MRVSLQPAACSHCSCSQARAVSWQVVPPHADLPGSPLGLVLAPQQQARPRGARHRLPSGGVFPSCCSSLVHVRTAAVCPPTAVFNSSQLCTGVSRITPCPANHPLITTLCGEDSSCRFIMHVCMYIERAVPAADIHTVKDCKLYVGGEILFPLRLLLRTCVYEPAVQLPYQKHACTYII